MASTHDLMIIARDVNFQDRIRYYMQSAAISVMAEAGNVVGHALRVAYAAKVLEGTASVFDYTIAFLTNGTIAAEANVQTTANSGFNIPDSDFAFTVNSLFNAFAGVVN